MYNFYYLTYFKTFNITNIEKNCFFNIFNVLNIFYDKKKKNVFFGHSFILDKFLASFY